MPRAHHVAVVVSAFLVCFGLSVRAVVPSAPATDDPALAFCRWADAVAAHVPGTADASLQVVWPLGPADRKAITDRLPGFFFLLTHPAAPQIQRAKIEARVDATAVRLSGKLTPITFLERAAMLHADAVMFDRRPPAPVPASNASAAPGLRLPRSVANPRPDETASVFTARDGEVTGATGPNWNWAFARDLLDHVRPIAADDTFVGIWYHATSAYMLRQGNFAEVGPHLEHAVEVLPDDAFIHFDLGCVAEGLAMNQFQQLVVDDRAATVFATPATRYGTAGVPRRKLTIPTADEGNALARTHYERALAANPDLVEAHVRLARELELAADYPAAATHIRLALAMSPPDEVAFYAHLFGARAALALGHADEAEAHVRAALDLFPTAGSALVAASHIAFDRADPGTAMERLDRLADPIPDDDKAIDPWRKYVFGPGRAAELPLTELWHRVPKLIGR